MMIILNLFKNHRTAPYHVKWKPKGLGRAFQNTGIAPWVAEFTSTSMSVKTESSVLASKKDDLIMTSKLSCRKQETSIHYHEISLSVKLIRRAHTKAKRLRRSSNVVISLNESWIWAIPSNEAIVRSRKMFICFMVTVERNKRTAELEQANNRQYELFRGLKITAESIPDIILHWILSALKSFIVQRRIIFEALEAFLFVTSSFAQRHSSETMMVHTRQNNIPNNNFSSLYRILKWHRAVGFGINPWKTRVAKVRATR